jgi:alpha-N-arabinofuranosidase
MKIMKWLLITPLLLLCGTRSAAARPNAANQETSSRPVTIQIHAERKANFQVPRTIFGTFLEPIGNSTYNGLWAEILQNPSFEENLWSVGNIERMVREEPALSRSSGLGLPLPWEPLDVSQGNRYEPRWSDAANSWRSLAVFGVPKQVTGVKQKVYLPTHRELHYTGSLYVKHLSGPSTVAILLEVRNHPDQILARASIDASATDWKKYSFNLDVAQGKLQPLQPVDFVLQVDGDERVLVDQASLMPADAIDGLDPDMVAMSKSMNTPLLRYGGNFTSAYHWRDGIGPRDKRVNALNIAWGIPEYNQFGTDEYLRFCELIGAQPQIALNLGSGTPGEAADWVRYVNEHWKQHSGLLWELGNELWGNWNLGYPTEEELSERTIQFSQAVRAVDPKAQLIATGQDPDVYRNWNAIQLKALPGTFDYLSTHFVVTTGRAKKNTAPDALTSATFALPVELGRQLRAMQRQIDSVKGYKDKVHIAFTEWLFHCCEPGGSKAPSFDNMGGAIAAGGFLNMLMENADVVPVSDMTGLIEFAGIWKKRGRVYAAPSYYAFRMYSTAQADQPVEVNSNAGHYNVEGGITRLPTIENVPYLDVVAATSQAGDRLTIFCVNRHLTEDIPATVTVSGFAPAGSAAVQSLYSDSIYDVNDEAEPEAIKPKESNVTVEGDRLQYTFRHESITRIDLTRK